MCSQDNKEFQILDLRIQTWTQHAVRASYELFILEIYNGKGWYRSSSVQLELFMAGTSFKEHRKMIVSLQKDSLDPVLGVVWHTIDSQQLEARGSWISEFHVSQGAW